MRLKNLETVYVYERNSVDVYGEEEISWEFKNKYMVNVQQDISEIDRNSAGEIDYDLIRLRTDQKLDIEKSNGVSFFELKKDENPKYIVDSNSLVGSSITYTCKVLGQ